MLRTREQPMDCPKEQECSLLIGEIELELNASMYDSKE